MIRTIRHKGLKRLFEEDDPTGVNPEHVGKLRNILATLHAARTVDHMNLPGYPGTPEQDTRLPRPVADLHCYGWQRHCRGLYHTPVAA